MYFTTEGVFPNDLHSEAIDPVTGAISDEFDSPYRDDFVIAPPIRVSPDGARVLLGSGDIYDGATLEIESSLPGSLTDALWLADGSLVTVSDGGSERTLLEHRDAALSVFNYRYYPGTPLRVVGALGEIAVVTSVSGRPAFHAYVPTHDSDGDGVPNAEDAFPVDPAASQDSDGDGAPDAWNPGYGPEDSTDGLVLDAFPNEFACQLEQQAIGGECDFAHVLPGSPAEGFCDEDVLEPAQGSGWIELGATSDFVPLCNGWLMIGDVANQRIAVRNAVDGREGAYYDLPAAPGDLELDEVAKVLYVALPDAQKLAELDLVTGSCKCCPSPAGSPRWRWGREVASSSAQRTGGRSRASSSGAPRAHRRSQASGSCQDVWSGGTR